MKDVFYDEINERENKIIKRNYKKKFLSIILFFSVGLVFLDFVLIYNFIQVFEKV